MTARSMSTSSPTSCSPWLGRSVCACSTSAARFCSTRRRTCKFPAQSSAVYVSLQQNELPGAADPDRTFLVFDLKVDGQTVSRNEVFFDTMRNLDLPLKPAIQSNISGLGRRFTVDPALAGAGAQRVSVLWRPRRHASDNYFDLLPGEEADIRLTTSATLEQLRQALKITSLTDAFFEERPSYRQHIAP